MRASMVMSVGPKSDNMETPKKSAMASSKKPRVPGRHISFAPTPTFFSIAEKLPPSTTMVSACSSKVCLCSPTNHPGSFRCRLHRSNPIIKSVSPTPSTYRKKTIV